VEQFRAVFRGERFDPRDRGRVTAWFFGRKSEVGRRRIAPDLPEGSEERDNALTNLRNITRILARCGLTLG
jgi:hypothetical protein